MAWICSKICRVQKVMLYTGAVRGLAARIVILVIVTVTRN